MKNNKGVTLVALVITVIILMIIATITISVSSNIIGEAKYEGLKTTLLLIQSKAKVMADKKAIGDITEDDLYGMKQTSGQYQNWYLLSEANLKNMGIKDADATDGYYVNYENDDVAFGAGFEHEGITYYKLSEML